MLVDKKLNKYLEAIRALGILYCNEIDSELKAQYKILLDTLNHKYKKHLEHLKNKSTK